MVCLIPLIKKELWLTLKWKVKPLCRVCRFWPLSFVKVKPVYFCQINSGSTGFLTCVSSGSLGKSSESLKKQPTDTHSSLTDPQAVCCFSYTPAALNTHNTTGADYWVCVCVRFPQKRNIDNSFSLRSMPVIVTPKKTEAYFFPLSSSRQPTLSFCIFFKCC